MAGDFARIREWDGSRHRAWEELCFQLRPAAPDGTTTIKTGDPDAGLEWYVTLPDGRQWGWQAKYSDDVDSLIDSMGLSLRTVVEKRSAVERLTYCVPVDLADGRDATAGRRPRQSARQRFEAAIGRWRRDIPGADGVEVVLDGGGEILDRLSLPEHAGRRWFWFQDRVLDQAWFRARLDETIEMAGDRYSPRLNVDLAIGRDLEGLARTPGFIERWRTARADLDGALANVEPHLRENPDGGALVAAIDGYRLTLPGDQDVLPADRTQVAEWAQAARDLSASALAFAYREGRGDERPPADAGARAHAARLGAAADDLADHVRSTAFRAAVDRAYLLTGAAGMGKTHLFVDHVARALDEHRPALVLLGQRLTGRRAWQEFIEQLGLAPSDESVVVGALEAAAEAHEARLVVLIDAINEADDPLAWAAESPVVRRRLLASPHLALGLSCRSGYDAQLAPEGGWEATYTVGRHPGFAGAESRAARTYFGSFGIEEPRVPLLHGAFENPLFLRVWCQGLQDAGLTSPPRGSDRMTEAFTRYLQGRSRRIAVRLGLDPEERHVERAASALAERMGDDGVGSLPREVAKLVVDGLAAHLTRWPDTLYGRMLSEGLVIEDARWRHDGPPERHTRFTFQLFSDHLVASAILARRTVPRSGALGTRTSFRGWLDDCPYGLRDALAILLPERSGRELPDLTASVDGMSVEDVRAFLRSLVHRRLDTIGERALALFERVYARSMEADPVIDGPEALGVLLAVAAEPDHPLNADWLHERLAALRLPVRDALWTIPQCDALEDPTSATARLVRWASEATPARYPDRVVELASLALAWHLTSPNRVLRDTATRALANLWRGHLAVGARLVGAMAGVDDPYVVERVALAAYGALLRADGPSPAGGKELADTVLATFFGSDEVVPQALTRDSAAGIVECAAALGLVDETHLARVRGPFRSAPPGTPSPPSEFERRRDSRRYGRLARSLSDWGDFGKYVVGYGLHAFSRAPRAGRPDSRLVHREFDPDRARRWVLDRVLSLGWSHALFGTFDDRSWRGQERPHFERIGKKYQWIAFDELFARLQDNYLPYRSPGGGHPWGDGRPRRDVDPSLPPPDPDDAERAPITSEPVDAWWVRGVPTLEADEDDGTWIGRTQEIPSLADCVSYASDGQGRWIALWWLSRWSVRPGGPDLDGRLHQWWRVQTWLVPADRHREVVKLLARESLMGNWMPMPLTFNNDVYLGEFGRVGEGLLVGGDEIRHRPTVNEVEPVPGTVEYIWEGNSRDASLRATAYLMVPSPELLTGQSLRWDGVSGRWLAGDTCIAEYHATDGAGLDGSQVVLMDEQALRLHLRANGLVLVAALLGEREGFVGHHEIIEPWYEVQQVGSWDGAEWLFGDRTVVARRKA